MAQDVGIVTLPVVHQAVAIDISDPGSLSSLYAQRVGLVGARTVADSVNQDIQAACMALARFGKRTGIGLCQIADKAFMTIEHGAPYYPLHQQSR